MKLNSRSFMMESIKQQIIIYTLLIMFCTNIRCNIIQSSQPENNYKNKDIKTNNLWNRNDQDTIFEDIVPHFNSDKLESISKILSLRDHTNKIQKIDVNEIVENDINIQNDDKIAELQNFNSNSDENFKILQNFLFKYVKKNILNSFFELLAGRSKNTISMDENKKSFSNFKKQLHQFFIENKSEKEPRSMESGRLFLFKGLKNLLWPLFIGVQIAKSILVALFLPSILGSLGIMVGKRLTSFTGQNHHTPPVGDLDFPDIAFPLDDQYKNPRPAASETHIYRQPFQTLTANLNNENNLSKFEFIDEKFPIGNPEIQNKLQKNKNIFGDFLKVPVSSLLLSNYDPFYSPLLSRIDSVFSQFKIEKDKEDCKSKLICFMYANPAKYAPYSNLVSAQLSRELNELQKPKNDNEEIIRFFKYMQAAKSGQDGNNCEELYNSCTDFKDSETPVMITTYNDINKLVEAKKFVH